MKVLNNNQEKAVDLFQEKLNKINNKKAKRGSRRQAKEFEKLVVELMDAETEVVFFAKNHEAPKHSSKNLPDFVGQRFDGSIILGEAKSLKLPEGDRTKSFPLNYLKDHQLEQLKNCDDNNGASYIFILLWKESGWFKIIKLDYKDFDKKIKQTKSENRKSIKIELLIKNNLW